MNRPVMDSPPSSDFPFVEDAIEAAPTTIAAALPCRFAAELFVDREVRALPVLEGGRLVGLLRADDVRRPETSANPVRDVMQRPPFVVHPRDLLDRALSAMMEERVDVAVVCDEGAVRGLLFVESAIRTLLRTRAARIPSAPQPAHA